MEREKLKGIKVIDNIFDEKLCLKNSYIAIGTFDSVHFGHQKLIKQAVEKAKENKGISVVFTFMNNPLELLAGSKAPKCINNISEKVELLRRLGVDIVILQPFIKRFAVLEAEEFVDILKNKLDAKEIMVGFNFSFGVGGASTPDDLKLLGNKKGIEVEEFAPIYIGDTLVSSTLIRNMLLNENIEKINRYLGHNYLIIGEVIHGKKLARQLGFPTANIGLEKRIYPKNGIYGVRVKIQGEEFYRDGVVNIGLNPTLKPGEKSIEVNILDFDQMIYGKIITVEFRKFLREERKCENIEELKTLIGNDILTWREILKREKG